MSRRSLVVLAILSACLGCRPTADPPGAPSPGPAPAWSPEQQKAVDLARDFLANSRADWGAPTSVERQRAGGNEWVGKVEDTYWLTYPTPADEVKVLGPRVVLVNTRTGKAMVLPRD